MDRQELEKRLRAIPKTETHLHIEGALPYQLLHKMDPERFPEEPVFRESGYKYPDFVTFERLLVEHAVAWYTSPERYKEACRHIFSDMASLNIKYVECSVHLAIAEFTNSDPREMIRAIKEAAPEGMVVRVVGAFVRNGYTEVMAPYIESLHSWDELDGIDLHGQEWLDLEDWSLPVWKRCKEAGKIIKVHAGEFGGPDKIVEALDALGAERVQHGVRAIEDPGLVERLSDEGVILDTCPISNEKLQVFPSLEEHSLKQLYDKGVICTINTDDPLCFANTLVDEYLALHDRLAFSVDDLAEIAKNGFRYARLDKAEKEKRVQEIDRILKG